ncbi:hypothetical protein D9M68_691180 [compost metagenome]
MRGVDADDGLQPHAQRAQVHARAVAFDHARMLELAHALAHRRLRQANALADRGQALARIGLQGFEDEAIFLVEGHGVRRKKRGPMIDR